MIERLKSRISKQEQADLIQMERESIAHRIHSCKLVADESKDSELEEAITRLENRDRVLWNMAEELK